MAVFLVQFFGLLVFGHVGVRFEPTCRASITSLIKGGGGGGGGVPAQLLPHFRCPTGLLILHGILCIFYVFFNCIHCIFSGSSIYYEL